MAPSSADWLESQADRTFARQRAQVDTAKLVATFAAAVAATLVATALQVGTEPRKLDVAATVVLAAAFVAVIVVVLCDRIAEADQGLVLARSRIYRWTDSKLVEELRAANLTAVHINREVIRDVLWALAVQVSLSVAASIVACFSLLT
jgi:hypothetical protein